MMREVQVSLPPFSDIRVPSGLSADMEAALREIAALDAEHPVELGALGMLLLRTECVASSRIEEIDAAVDDYARALHGVKANPSATSMVAATTATDVLLTKVTNTRVIGVDDLMAAHQELMRGDPTDGDYAGRVRDMQNWIGGSQYSPRDDVPTLTQAAIALAQFESIHPFTDGNGRIGRALINSVLRRRAVTTTVVVPLGIGARGAPGSLLR